MLKLRKVIPFIFYVLAATAVFSQETGLAINYSKLSPHHVDQIADGEACSDNPIYNKIIALKSKYPEGKRWTNAKKYAWKGGIYSGGYGCLGFAFILSDAAFGDLPARKHHDLNNLRVGDILRINHDTHAVVILCIEGSTVTIAEGNFNASVHWGRTFTMKEIKARIDYVMTRYPE